MRAAGIFYRPREAFYRVAAVVVLVVVIVLSVYFTARTPAGSRFLWTVAACTVVIALDRYGVSWRLVLALACRDTETARSCLQAARIRRGWDSLARSLRLVEVQRGHEGPFASTPDRDKTYVIDRATKYRAPRLRIKPDPYGAVITLRTVPGIGLTEIQRHIEHIADQWRAVRVSVVQGAPGRLRIRAVRRDPLAVPTEFDAAATAAGDLASVPIGMDEYAQPITLPLKEVSGITVAGVPGTGKTSFLLGLTARLAPRPEVAMLLLDGKVDDPSEEGDYAPVVSRFSVAQGDDLKAAVQLLEDLVAFRRRRARSLRALLNTSNVWRVGFTVLWPLLVLVVDECQTYTRQVKAGPATKERDALAARCADALEDLIKKGRSVGVIVILSTQKPTSDSLPTALRDNCAVSIAFGLRTIDAAVASLGDDIRQAPEASPVELLAPEYRGCAVMRAEGATGFVRLRTPYCDPEVAGAIAEATASLVVRRGDLPAVPDADMIGAGSDGD